MSFSGRKIGKVLREEKKFIISYRVLIMNNVYFVFSCFK